MMTKTSKPKTVTVPFTGVSVTLPSGARGWQLYSTMQGSGLAASRLTKAMEKALTAPSREDAIKIMRAALRADADYGACDTEPRCVAEHLLTKGRGTSFGWTL
jgi:hypothetical protein